MAVIRVHWRLAKTRACDNRSRWRRHHQEHAQAWSVAVSTVRLYRSRSWARC